MKKVRIKKPLVKKPIVSQAVVKGVELTDYTKAGFSNAAPGSPQAKAFIRKEILPSQVNEGKSL